MSEMPSGLLGNGFPPYFSSLVGWHPHDAGTIELRRRQRQLVTLARAALFPRSLHVQPLALAPGAGERAVDVNVDAEIGALRADLVRRDHVIHQRLDEGGLVEIEKGVAGGLRCGDRRLWGRLGFAGG